MRSKDEKAGEKERESFDAKLPLRKIEKIFYAPITRRKDKTFRYTHLYSKGRKGTNFSTVIGRGKFIRNHSIVRRDKGLERATFQKVVEN